MTFQPQADAILSHLCYSWISPPGPQWAQFRRKRVPVHWTGQANTFHSATTHDTLCSKGGLCPYQITDIKRIWNLVFGHQKPGIEYRIYQIYQIQDIRCQISGYPMQGIGYRVQRAKSIYLRLREQNSPLSTLWQRELEVRIGEIGETYYI